MKRLLALLLSLLSFASCEDGEIIEDKENYQLIYNIPNSNWDSIITMSEENAFCINIDANQNRELLAIINNNTEFRLKFDELTRPITFAVDKLYVDIIYAEEYIKLIYSLNGVSDIQTYPMLDILQTRASGEDAIKFTAEIVKSQLVDYVIDIIDGMIEKKIEYPILGPFKDFVDLVNTLRDLDNLKDALDLVDYMEAESDLRKFIDLIRTRPTLKEDNATTYIVGLTAGSAQVNDNIVTLELLGTIIGKSRGKDLDFEYGLCYSKNNSNPIYTDAKVSTKFTGMSNQTYIEVTLPQPFTTRGLEDGKYNYRGYFKDNDTGNIIYSDNVQSFTITYKPMILNSISYKNDYYYYEKDGKNYIAYNCTANISGNTSEIENLSSCGIYIHDSNTGKNYIWKDGLSGNYSNENIDFFIGIPISNFDNLDYTGYYAESTIYSFGTYVEFNDGTYYWSEPKPCSFVYKRDPSYKFLSVGKMTVSVTGSYEDDNGETITEYKAEHPYSYAIDGALWIENLQWLMEGGNWVFTTTGEKYAETWTPSRDRENSPASRLNTYNSNTNMSHVVYQKIVTKSGKTEYSNSLVYGGTPESPTVSIGGVMTSSVIANLNSRVSSSNTNTSSCGHIDGVAISDMR